MRRPLNFRGAGSLPGEFDMLILLTGVGTRILHQTLSNT